MLNIRTIAALATISCLCACASPTREDSAAFATLTEGMISKSDTPAFADCVLDGFDKAHYSMTMVSARQQRRSDSYRIETTSALTILVSADVFDDGRVRLTESSQAALVNTKGEKEAFQRCFERFRGK
jgi:hypothetical protein